MKIKVGSSRFVFIINNYVIKVPIFLSWRRFISGIVSNFIEYNSYMKTKSDYINRILFNFGGIITISERLDEITENEFNNLSEENKIEFNKFIFNDIEFVYKNIGKKTENGITSYKLIDYGFNIYPIKKSKTTMVLKNLRTVLNLY